MMFKVIFYNIFFLDMIEFLKWWNSTKFSNIRSIKLINELNCLFLGFPIFSTQCYNECFYFLLISVDSVL